MNRPFTTAARCAASAFALAMAAPLTLTATSAAAAETPPQPTTPRPFAVPDMSEYAIANGMKVTLIQHGEVPKVQILAAVRTGNIDDGENVWLADLTGALMKKGANGKDAAALAEAAAGMGGSLSLSTGLDRTSASIDVLSEFAPAAIALVGDQLRQPDLPADQLETVRSDLLRQLQRARSQPGSIVSEAFQGLLYPDHPYGRLMPSEEQLAGYDLAQIQQFHADNFGARRTHLYIVGRFDEAQVRAAIESAFSSWAEGPEPSDVPAPESAAPSVVLIDRPGAPQSNVSIGKRVPPPGEDVSIKAMDTLLGGYFSSRITRNIREDKGYTYSPHSTLSQRVEGAYWAQSAAVTAEATGPSITEIYKEIRRMQAEPPSEAEVRGIKNYMNGIFVIGLASRSGLAGSLANLDTLGLGADYLDSYVEKVSALSAADFQDAARRDLDTDAMSVVVLGPLDTVREQLEAVPEIADRLPQ